eukprot:2034495-Pleurochrysis_carterae.AAC.2
MLLCCTDLSPKWRRARLLRLCRRVSGAEAEIGRARARCVRLAQRQQGRRRGATERIICGDSDVHRGRHTG